MLHLGKEEEGEVGTIGEVGIDSICCVLWKNCFGRQVIEHEGPEQSSRRKQETHQNVQQDEILPQGPVPGCLGGLVG